MTVMISNQTRNDNTYVPPRLPSYLSATYELKPIVGVPNDEDVKAIHAVIRTANAVAHGTALGSSVHSFLF